MFILTIPYICLFAAIAVLLAAITAAEIVALLTPILVLLATEAVKKLVPLVAGWAIVMLIVPLLSIAVAWISGLITDPGLGFWAQVGYGLLAVFINQAYKQLKELFQ